jgi:hypothetical protein
MTPHHHPPYNHHSNKHDVKNNEPTTTGTSISSTIISSSEGTDDTLPMMAFYEDWWRTYQSQSSSVPSRPPPPPASSGSSNSTSSHIIRDPTSQPQQSFVRWLSQYWSTQLEFHSLLNWNRTAHHHTSSSSGHCTRPNETATYDHPTNATTSATTTTTTTTSRRRIGTTNPLPPPEDHHHHHRMINTAILQQLYRHYYDHHRSAVLHANDNEDEEDGTTTDATATTSDAAGPVAVASVVTSHDYGTSVSLSSVEEFFQEYPDCCTARQPWRHGRSTDVPDDDSSRTASSDDVEEVVDGQQHVIVGSGNDPIEVDNDDDNNPWVVSLPSSTHNNNNHTKKNMSTQLQQQQQYDRSQWNERSVTAITDTTASTKHIPSLDNGTTTQRISPTSIIMEPLRPPSTHPPVVANDSAPVGSTSSNNGNPHLNPYQRMDRNRNTNHVPPREEGMVPPPPPPKSHVPPPPQQHPTAFSSSSWDDYGPTTSIHNPFQTAREVAAAHPTTIPRRQSSSYHHSEYDDQSGTTNDGPYHDHICTTSYIPYDDRNHRNQSTNQHVPHMWPATSANTTMVGHSDPSTKMNPYHPIPHQQKQLHHPPVPVIRESLKRKFQPPIKRDSNHHHHPTTAVDAQPTTTDSAPNNASSSRTRMGGSIQTVTTRRPQSQPPKMPATAASKTNSHNCSDTADTTSDELPEELQIYGKELVMKIENEIMDQTTEDPITFQDIAGLHDQKQTVYEIVCWPMQRPDLFTGLRRAPNGLLLYGPPGTGKMSVVSPILFVSIVLSFLNQFVIVLVILFRKNIDWESNRQ